MREEAVEQAAEALGVPVFKLQGLLDRGTVAEEDGHLRFKKAVAGQERGTAYFPKGDDVVRGFPKIRRTLVLDPSTERHFDDEVVVEEKMNGYNVRIASVGGELVALTRGGIVCPYTLHWAERTIGTEVFEGHTELVVCGEMVGPDNPYVTSDTYDVDSIQFFVFDVRRKGTNEPLTVDERRRFVRDHGLKGVPEKSRVEADEPEEIEEAVEELDREGKEGIVMKDPEMELDPVKYTTSSGNCSDLRYAFRYFQEYGSDFIYPRAVREGFRAWEQDGDLDDLAERVGRSILEPIVQTAQEKEEGERLTETVHIRVHEEEVIEEFEKHLRSTGTDAIFHEPEELEDGSLRVQVERIHQSTNDKTEDLLQGGFW